MQFNIVPRTGGLAINREKLRKKRVRRHNFHSMNFCAVKPLGAGDYQAIGKQGEWLVASNC